MSIAAAQRQNLSVPELAPLPQGVPRRIIDDGTIHYEASLAGYAERYGRGETPHTVHVWWARRPHSSMRALTFACLCEDRSTDAVALMRALSARAIAPSALLGE